MIRVGWVMDITVRRTCITCNTLMLRDGSFQSTVGDMETPKHVTDFLDSLEAHLIVLGDRVAVLPDEKEVKTSSGIERIQTGDTEAEEEGVVIAYGEGAMGESCLRPLSFVSLGEKVKFGPHMGSWITLKNVDGKKFAIKILHVDEILAVCNPKS